MTFFKRMMYYLRLLIMGKRELFRALDEEANIYYDKCDYIKQKHEATLFSLMVANISCEIYEQLIYGMRHTQNDDMLDTDAVKAMYRTNIMYFYIKLAYDFPYQWESIKNYDLKGLLRLSAQEKQKLANFLTMIELSPNTFELEFLKYYSKVVFKQNILTPYTVALAGNILYNSYEGFTEDFSMHLTQFKIA